MKKLRNSPLTVTCMLLAFCATALIAFVKVYANPPGNQIHACYNDTNGGLRRVNSPSNCRNHETSISWNIAGAQGPAGPPGATGPQGPAGPGGTNLVTFRHTRTIANTCGPFNNFSFIDHPAINGNGNALVFVTGIVGINGDRSNTNPNSNLNLTYTGSASFGTCPAGRWIVAGGDNATRAQFQFIVGGS